MNQPNGQVERIWQSRNQKIRFISVEPTKESPNKIKESFLQKYEENIQDNDVTKIPNINESKINQLQQQQYVRSSNNYFNKKNLFSQKQNINININDFIKKQSSKQVNQGDNPKNQLNYIYQEQQILNKNNIKNSLNNDIESDIQILYNIAQKKKQQYNKNQETASNNPIQLYQINQQNIQQKMNSSTYYQQCNNSVKQANIEEEKKQISSNQYQLFKYTGQNTFKPLDEGKINDLNNFASKYQANQQQQQNISQKPQDQIQYREIRSISQPNEPNLKCNSNIFNTLTMTVLYQCIHCKSNISSKLIMLKCQHQYCEQCLTEHIQKQIFNHFFRGKIFCYCNIQLNVNSKQLPLNNFKVLSDQIFIKQIEIIKTQYEKQIQKCQESKCNFFWMSNNQYQKSSYCPNCLVNYTYYNYLKK